MARFRIRSSRHFLTFPKCNETPDACVERIQDKFHSDSNFLWCVVAQETHEDGDKHLHGLVIFKSAHEANNASYWDFVAGQHGNYKSVGAGQRNLQKTAVYVSKEGGPIAFSGITSDDFIQLCNDKSDSVLSSVWSSIKRNAAMADIIEESPGMLLNIRRIREAQDVWAHEVQKRKVRTSFYGRMFYNDVELGNQFLRADMSDAFKSIADWCNGNFGGERFKKRPIRAPQLWVVAPPGSGKTTMVDTLRQYLNVYDVAYETFQDNFENRTYDLAVFDEFVGQLPISWMNRWLDGSYFNLRRKGVAAYPKDHNIPTVVLSNFHPEECYKNVDPVKVEALKGRLKIVQAQKEDFLRMEITTRNLNDIERADSSQELADSQVIDLTAED